MRWSLLYRALFWLRQLCGRLSLRPCTSGDEQEVFCSSAAVQVLIHSSMPAFLLEEGWHVVWLFPLSDTSLV